MTGKKIGGFERLKRRHFEKYFDTEFKNLIKDTLTNSLASSTKEKLKFVETSLQDKGLKEFAKILEVPESISAEEDNLSIASNEALQVAIRNRERAQAQVGFRSGSREDGANEEIIRNQR